MLNLGVIIYSETKVHSITSEVSEANKRVRRYIYGENCKG